MADLSVVTPYERRSAGMKILGEKLGFCNISALLTLCVEQNVCVNARLETHVNKNCVNMYSDIFVTEKRPARKDAIKN